MNASPDITQLIERWKTGDRVAENALIAAIYPLLRGLAQKLLNSNPAVLTLSATDLAHEAYLRLSEQRVINWSNRDHFFAIAATVLRRVVVDYLRERAAEKRSGGKILIGLDNHDSEELIEASSAIDWIAMDQALQALEKLDAECARVVELKLFSTLTADQIALQLGSSTATIGRHWRFAKSWLAEQLDAPSVNDAV